MAKNTKPAPALKTTPTPAKTNITNFKASASGIVFDPDGSIRTPKGTAFYAYLVKPDQYKDKEPCHKITVSFAPGEALDEMVDRILKFENAYLATIGKKARTAPACVKDCKNIEGNKMVTFTVGAKMGDKGKFIPVDIVDAAAQPTTKLVYSGDTVRVVFSLGGYDGFGGGAKPYLRAVQLLKSNGGTGTKATSMFESDPEYATEGGAGDELPDEAEESPESPAEGEGEDLL